MEYDIWCLMKSALNSNFTVALVGSLSGAFGGAIAAQKIIESKRNSESFIEEIRNINAAIMVSFSICNILLSLKSQHVLGLYNSFNADLGAVEKFNERHALNDIAQGEIFHFEANFKNITPPAIPIDTLKNLLFNKISIPGRPLNTIATLEGAFIALSEALVKRTTIIERFKGIINQQELVFAYFGLTMPSGHTDQEYPDTIEAILKYTDDVIFFSALICKDLNQYGEKLKSENKKLPKNTPKISKADFSTQKAIELMPPESNYTDWFKGFKQET